MQPRISGLRIVTALLAVMLVAGCQTIAERPGFSAGQVAVLEGNGFGYIDGQYELGLEQRVLFSFNSSELLAGSDGMLAQLSQVLSEVGISGAILEGHTDSVGELDYNHELSRQRAEAVRQVMSLPSIRVVPFGETDPLESNDTEQGRQQNRRVVIVITAADAGPG